MLGILEYQAVFGFDSEPLTGKKKEIRTRLSFCHFITTADWTKKNEECGLIKTAPHLGPACRRGDAAWNSLRPQPGQQCNRARLHFAPVRGIAFRQKNCDASARFLEGKVFIKDLVQNGLRVGFITPYNAQILGFGEHNIVAARDLKPGVSDCPFRIDEQSVQVENRSLVHR